MNSLGNTRAVVDTAGVLLQTMNYYPSGVPFSRMEQEPITDRLHTGKPFLDMSGLGYYDNNARFLDILTGSFISRDALAGSYPHLSPYTNCANNPLIYIDPTGMETKEFVDETNEKDKVIAEVAKKYPENKDIQIFAHGDTKGIDVFIDGGTERIENANTLIKLINKYFETGKNITNNSDATIVLHSCNTGRGNNSFAKNISEEMPNATIIAPNGYVVINSISGRMEVSKTRSSFDKKGEWRVFKQGEIVNTLPLDAKPNGDPGESFFHEIKSFITTLFE